MATKPPDQDMLELLRVRVGLAADDASKDATIELAYIAAVTWLEKYLDRFLEAGNFIERFPHFMGLAIHVKGYPVDNVNSLKADGRDINYHLDSPNGIIHLDGLGLGHEVEVDYTCTPDMSGPIILALLSAFDQSWAAFSGAQSATVGGAIKQIAIDGMRVEYETGTGASAGFGGIDQDSGLPEAMVAILAPYRRRWA